MQPIDDLDLVIRRVVAARVSDRHLIEDLTQETLVRVTAAAGRLTPDAQRAYAIVTARNVVISHARSEAVHHRHAHRLVEYTGLDGPEQLALEREETDALATALARIDPQDRQLLLEHEADGVGTEQMAHAAGLSRSAMSMRLARARAALRVEFLLAFRRLELPTEKCRQVLRALSAGDRRRQVALGASQHLLRCPTCAELARPATERRRSIAAWLFVPAWEALRRGAATLRRSGRAQAAAGVAIVLAATAIVFAVVAHQPDDATDAAGFPERAATTTAAVGAAAAPTLAAPPTTVAATPSTIVNVASPNAPACPTPPAVLDQLVVGAPGGCAFAPTAVTVVEVPADEGFWAETATGRAVWVQLVGDGESPIEIVAGVQLVIGGVVADPAASPPPPEDRLGRDGHHVQVGYDQITTG